MIGPVHARRDFEALSASRCRGRSGPVWLARAPRVDDDACSVRVAYAVGKQIGGAVVRNRLRRRLRAAMHELDRAGQVIPGQYLVGARPAATTTSFAELRSHLSTALADAS